MVGTVVVLLELVALEGGGVLDGHLDGEVSFHDLGDELESVVPSVVVAEEESLGEATKGVVGLGDGLVDLPVGAVREVGGPGIMKVKTKVKESGLSPWPWLSPLCSWDVRLCSDGCYSEVSMRSTASSLKVWGALDLLLVCEVGFARTMKSLARLRPLVAGQCMLVDVISFIFLVVALGDDVTLFVAA